VFEKPTPLDTLNSLVQITNQQTDMIQTLGEELIKQQTLLGELVDQHRRVIHQLKIANAKIQRLESKQNED
jgi:hypothetical protein